MPPATRYSVMDPSVRRCSGRIRRVDAVFAGLDAFLTAGWAADGGYVKSAVGRTADIARADPNLVVHRPVTAQLRIREDPPMSAAPIRHDVVRRPLMYGAERRVIAAELAAECGGVVHRLALAQHGIDRFGIRRRGRGRPLVQGWSAYRRGGFTGARCGCSAVASRVGERRRCTTGRSERARRERDDRLRPGGHRRVRPGAEPASSRGRRPIASAPPSCSDRDVRRASSSGGTCHDPRGAVGGE